MNSVSDLTLTVNMVQKMDKKTKMVDPKPISKDAGMPMMDPFESSRGQALSPVVMADAPITPVKSNTQGNVSVSKPIQTYYRQKINAKLSTIF
jgi:hypothetical protein